MSNSAERGIIKVHLHNLNQLFDTLGPSPFREKDLDPKADEFIVEIARELCLRPREIVLHLDQALNDPAAQQIVTNAIRTHFARRSELSGRELRQLMRRGLISLAIGLAFLTILFVSVQATRLASVESGVLALMRESMIIVGWVAMCRPLDIFLYDWWPIVGERRLHDRLSRVKVWIKTQTKV
jgi:hypothetical protein